MPSKCRKHPKTFHVHLRLPYFVKRGIMAHTYYDGLANENSLIAISNDPVFNNKIYVMDTFRQNNKLLL